MGNAQGTERRIHDEASHYEGDLCFVSVGAGGCFGARRSPAIVVGHDDDRGSAAWESSKGLNPVKDFTSMQQDRPRAEPATTKMKRPCLVSCSLGNCMAPKRFTGRDEEDDAHHRGRSEQGESIVSCGFARMGCLTPTWLNPAVPQPTDDGEEQRKRESQVEIDIVLLKKRHQNHDHQQKQKLKQAKPKKSNKRESVEISRPHLETFRRTTDDFISAHLAMCPDPRARVQPDHEEGMRVVSLEASAPPPPSTGDGPWEQSEGSDSDETIAALPSPRAGRAADSRGRSLAPAANAEKDLLPPPGHLPPPPPPPASAP
jgi:hypothetical protein